MDAQAVIGRLNRIYGADKGFRIYAVVMPGILKDFRRMLEAAAPGETVREEYRLEDGKAAIFLTGRRNTSGEAEIEAEVC